MERLAIIFCRLYKYVASNKYLFKVKLVGHSVALVGLISRPVESLLKASQKSILSLTEYAFR